MDFSRKSARDARHRASVLIFPALGDKECNALTTKDLENWRDAVASAPKQVRTPAGEKQRFGPRRDDAESIRRRRASTNRTLTILKAALNRAWRARKIASDDAWRRLGSYEQVDAARVRYLSMAEAKHLINAAADDFRWRARAALATGARYGELIRLTVADFNPDSGTLHVRTSKSGMGRHIVLDDEGLSLFSVLATGRPAGARLLKRSDGGQWKQSHQARPMREACKRARIEPIATFHCLRHTFCSHAIMNGAPLLVVAKNLGHCDTRMVERHYGHLAPSYIADAIRAAAPRFGLLEANIEPFAGQRG